MNPRRAPRTQPIQPPTFAPTKAKKPLIDSSTPSLVTDCEPGRFADRRRSWTPEANETRSTDGAVAREQRQVERPRRGHDQPVGGIVVEALGKVHELLRNRWGDIDDRHRLGSRSDVDPRLESLPQHDALALDQRRKLPERDRRHVRTGCRRKLLQSGPLARRA